MKYNRCLYLLFIVVIAFGGFRAAAAENIAQEAYAIFEANCLRCHGTLGAFSEDLLIDRTTLIETRIVLPGNAEASEFYKRLIEDTAEKPRMPWLLPALSDAELATIRRWIDVGAPDWNAVVNTDPDFITSEELLTTLETHLASLDPFDRSFARYFSSTHLYNAGEPTQVLNAYQRALSKLVNSLSWGIDVINPAPINSEETLFYIDLRDYEWEIGINRWTQIEAAYPYRDDYTADAERHLHEKLTQLRGEMDCEVPIIHVDWFLATAALPPLYHDILGLPETDWQLEARLEVDVVENIRNAPGKRVWRAGFNNSRVSRHNRVVERHRSRYGAYWKSYDFAGSVGTQNIFNHPLSFQHDGGEIIFNLPNGLQAYYLADARGNRLDAAPINIVSNPAASDPTVRNGLSCIGCHTEGMKPFEDEVRRVVQQNENPPFDKDRALRLYVEKTVIDGLLEEDTDRYRQALSETGSVFGGIEPVQRFHEAFQAPLDASHAAAAVGLETEVFLENIRRSSSLQNLGLLLLENGTVKRDTWTAQFQDVVFALDFPVESEGTPVVPQTERIPGTAVYIPDPALRHVIVNVLGLSAHQPITAEDMAKVIHLSWEHQIADSGIQNLTGLEAAVNLESLVLQGNHVSDLSPIAGLTKLRYLFLRGSPISDLAPIAGLTHLEHLAVNAKALDVSPIAGLTHLKHIQLWGANEIRFSVFANLKNLESLNMWHGTISNLQEITRLTGLKHLEIYDHQLEDISPIAQLKGLKTLRLGGNRNITDASPIAGLINLEFLDLHHDSISDLSPLAGLKNLKYLNLYDNRRVSDVSRLSGLVALEELHLNNNNISDVSALAGLINLKILDLRDNPITDASSLATLLKNTEIRFDVRIPDARLHAKITEALGKTQDAAITVAEMRTLTRLSVGGQEVQDLEGIQFATNLEELNMWSTSVSDLSPLSRLTNLKSLRFTDSPVSDLSPLAELTNLRTLILYALGRDNIGNFDFRLDISPLAGLIELRTLHLYWNNGLYDISPLEELTNLSDLNLKGTAISDISPLSALTNLRRLNLSGMFRQERTSTGDLLTHHDLLSDISALEGLTRLSNLNLDQNNISDVSPLAGLTGLVFLHLAGNNISDVSPLANLENLSILEIQANNISDISPLEVLREKLREERREREYTGALYSFHWYGNPCFPQGGPKIEGPWLWVLVPGKNIHNAYASGEGVNDFLSQASNGAVTELGIATSGATEGKPVGSNVWTSHKIAATVPEDSNAGNIRVMLNAIDMQPSGEDVVYGTLTLYAPHEQKVNMFAGSQDAHKVWLNGELVRDWSFHASWGFSQDYEDFFPVTLKTGKNVLLVALGNLDTFWNNAFFGFEPNTEYQISTPRVGYAFSDSKIHVGDTFNLDLSAENVLDLAGWQFDIAFDPARLEAIEVNEGNFLKAEGGATFFQEGTIDNTAGKITRLNATRFNADGATGTGTLLSVTFSAKAEGETRIALNNFQLGSTTGEVIPAGPHEVVITIAGHLAVGDVNRDGQVSVLDLILVSRHLGEGAAANPQADVTGDGIINIQDLIFVAQHLGESTDAAAPSAVAMETLALDPTMLQAWIQQAEAENDGSLAFRQGIANLQRLLATLLPQETALFANYPNPFNPETWIPYQLTTPADVSLTIYDVRGVIVRQVAVGHQPAGFYTDSSRAAYWDGRNSVGEPVASGVYFYTITTDDFTATRKMLIRK